MDTPSELVQLEIQRDWWVWRGFWPFDRGEERFVGSPELQDIWSRKSEPMDEHDFEEAHAFPLLKPSIDVLGVPCRSRKQRGWYHVRSSSRPAVPLSCLASHSIPSAAALPPELVSMITESLGFGRSRREMGSCARVCRYWADVLQPQLFENTRLRSLQDVWQLRAFQDNPLSKLSQFTCLYTAEQALASAPFLHRLLAIRSTPGCDVNAVVRGPMPSWGGTCIRSIAPHIPRSLPRAAFSRINGLTLEDIHFQPFTNLLRLVRELDDLRRIVGTRLTWPNQLEPPTLPTARLQRRRHPDDSSSVLLYQSNANQRWLALWLIGATIPTYEYRVLVRQVDETLHGVDRLDFGDTDIRTQVDWFAVEEGVSLSLRADKRWSEDLEASFFVEIRGDASAWISSINWPLFARTLSSFADVRRITVRVKEKSQQRVAYMEHAHEHLEALSHERSIPLDLRDYD